MSALSGGPRTRIASGEKPDAVVAAAAEALERDGRLGLLRTYIQHGSVTTYDHVCRVAQTAWRWARRSGLPVCESELLRGALLHDYYLYDWHGGPNRLHAVNHPVIAATNACEDFELSLREENIIAAHMWPLPPLPWSRVPQSREAWLVCAADKWCSLAETLLMRR